MKKKELNSIARRLASEFPGWIAHENLAVITPVSHTLRGLALEQSSDPRAFYANVFFQPLCVPSEHVSLNLGWRLGGGARAWNADDPATVSRLRAALEEEALAFLSAIQTPADVVAAARALNRSADLRAQQATAYALAAAGAHAEAAKVLEEHIPMLNQSIGWQNALAKEFSAFRTLLLSDAVETAAQLKQWETQTAANLRLDALRIAESG